MKTLPSFHGLRKKRSPPPDRQMSVFGLAPGSVNHQIARLGSPTFRDSTPPREKRSPLLSDERPGTTTGATMALMDTVGKMAGKVTKFADDYKVRILILALARAILRGGAPRAFDHSRRPQPYAIADADALASLPPARSHVGLLPLRPYPRHHRHWYDYHAPAQPLPAPHPRVSGEATTTPLGRGRNRAGQFVQEGDRGVLTAPTRATRDTSSSRVVFE